MARDHIAVLADQDRIAEPECPDAASDLGDLRLAVSAGVARRRDQAIEWPELEPPSIVDRVAAFTKFRSRAHLSSLASELPPTLNFATNFQGRARGTRVKIFPRFSNEAPRARWHRAIETAAAASSRRPLPRN